MFGSPRVVISWLDNFFANQTQNIVSLADFPRMLSYYSFAEGLELRLQLSRYVTADLQPFDEKTKLHNFVDNLAV
jgi:hypothetical protein